jgi:hypothetical protein
MPEGKLGNGIKSAKQKTIALTRKNFKKQLMMITLCAIFLSLS